MRKNKCKWYKKMRTKKYSRCLRDNSIRKKGCTCPYFELSLWSKFVMWLRSKTNG